MTKYDYMKIALSESKKSPDPATQVGCILVNREGEIVGRGYNNLLNGTKVDLTAVDRTVKRYYMVHAEALALLTSDGSATTAYCTHAPCIECMKLLQISGVKHTYYQKCLASSKTVNLELLKIYKELVISTQIKIENVNTGKSFIEELMRYAKGK